MSIQTRIALALVVAVTCFPQAAGGQDSKPENISPVVVRTTLMPGIPDVSHIPPGLTVAEPTIVADPERPDHVAVAAMVEHRTRTDSGFAKNHRSHASTRVWYSTDGATTWSEGQDLLPEFSGIAADLNDSTEREVSDGDPDLAVLPDGRFSVAVIVAEWFGSNVTRPNTGEGPYEGLFVATQREPGSPFIQETRIGLSDLPDTSYSYPHVPTLFADRGSSSPHRGNLYLTYFARMNKGTKHRSFLKISEDGGDSFGPPKVLPKSKGAYPKNDGVIGPDGTMHLLMTPDSTQAFYLTSQNGGRSFSKPSPIPLRGDPSSSLVPAKKSDNWPHLAVGKSGENRGVVFGAVEQKQNVSRSKRVRDVKVFPISGAEETGAPRRLDPGLDSTEQVRLPALAVSKTALWVLAYRQGKYGTEVVLYRSTDDGYNWEESRVVATRDTKDFYPGHYIGLSAVGNRLYAAYTLPTVDPARPVGLYTSVIEVR